MARQKRIDAATRRILNVIPSARTEDDWGLEIALSSGVVKKATPLPAEVDLRADWWEVGDQRETGGCVGFASADGVLRYHLVRAGKLRKNQRLSARFARPQTFIEKAGTSLKAALDVGRKYGAVLDSILPFDVRDLMYTGEEDDFYAAAAQRKVASYYNLGRSPRAWRIWLASHGPILAAIGVDESWHQARHKKGRLDRYRPSTVEGGHAVCVVGYRRDGRFIVRNSWGTGFGDRGFAYPTEAWVKAAFLKDSYGVTV